MKTFSKIIFLSIFVLFTIFGLNCVQAASDFDLEKLEFDAKLNSDGSMNVTETWQIEVNGKTNTLFKTFKIDNEKYSEPMDVSVSEIINGEETPFKQNDTWKNHVDTNCFHALEYKGEFEIAWGINVSRGRHTYIVKYKINDVVTVHNDCAELYWQFIGDKFEAPASEVSGRITLPNNVELLDDLRVWGHGQLNGYAERENNNTVLFNVKPFITGKFLEIRVAVLEPEMFEQVRKRDEANVVDSIIEEETSLANKANKEREEYARKEKERQEYYAKRQERAKYIVTGVSIAIGIVFIVLIINVIKKLKETPNLEPTETPEYFRDIPNKNESVAEVGFLYYYKKSGQGNWMPKALSATLLDLSLKKYVKFEVDDTLPKKEQVTIRLIDDPNAEELKDSEKLILDLFKKVANDKKTDSFNMKEFEKYAKKHSSYFANSIEKIMKKTKQEQKDEGNYDEKMEKKHNNWFGAGVSIITVFAFISLFIMVIFEITVIPLIFVIIPGIIYAVLCLALAGKYSGLTEAGLDERAKWEALKRYMQDYSLIKDRDVPQLVVWEKYLVYATLFGNAESVLKQIKAVYPQFENDDYLNNTSYFYLISHTNFNDSFVHSVESTIMKSYESSIASSYSSSGGGYGGGFSGGGGGRRRRRPEAEDAKNREFKRKREEKRVKYVKINQNHKHDKCGFGYFLNMKFEKWQNI